MDESANFVNVECIYLPVINFAMQQNRVSVIRLFSIENKTEEAIKDINIVISAEPDFAITESHRIEILPAKEILRVNTFKLNLSTNFFAQLTERLAGNLIIEIFSGENLLFKNSYPIDILAFDEWGGTAVLPEMLSSFITPNHPAIAPIIKRASVVLEQWTGSSALDEYQSRNPDRVRKQMAAIFTAISEQSIAYSTVPASFEAYGQRIRLVDALLSQKLGTCLDMALLYASCLEAIGIHSLIIVIQGHAFAGGWLISETFPDSIIDDVSFLTKRTADGINEITLVETTCMNQGNIADFDQAVRSADNKLLHPSSFILALDVKRSRFTGIRPLPQRILNGQTWEIKEEEMPLADKSQLIPTSINPHDLSDINQNVEVTKQLLWERKLLDLSLRNNLLNIRITRNTLQLISADLDKFEDALADGDEFRIMPKPSDWDNPLYDSGLHQSVGIGDAITDLIKSEITQKRLRSYLTETELNKSLLHIYRSSRLSLEENGANTLYLALGLLKWFETPQSERPRYAPILLLPVEIIRKSAAQGYVVRSREEDTMMNITLLEMLRQNFGITVSGLDPLPTDEKGIDTKLVYSILRNSIKNQPKWDVEEQAILGIFSFNKFIMWNDIHSNAQKMAQNKVVSSLINGKIEWDIQDDFVDATLLDKDLSPADIVLPINADSSQLEAIYEAVSDKSYILHGPPGTGKSQTITNIIANALYKGKRVLFVAEKMAALSVVQKRLTAIGLAPFCMELHSNKAKKSSVLAQLKVASEVIKHTSPENFQQEAARLHLLRADLNSYIEILHKKYPFGISFYEAISHYLSNDNDFEIPIPQTLLGTLTPEKLLEWRDVVETLVNIGNACGHPYDHPLTGIKMSNYSSTIKEEASQYFTEALSLLSTVKNRIQNLNFIIANTGIETNKKQLEYIVKIIESALNIPELTPELLTQPRLSEVIDEYEELIKHGKEKDSIKNNLMLSFTENILSVDAKQWLNEWNEYTRNWFVPKYFGQKKLRKQITIYSKNNGIKSNEIKGILSQIIVYQEKEKYLQPYANNLPLLFGKYGKNKNWEVIDQILTNARSLNSIILNFAGDIEKSIIIKENLAKQLTEGIDIFKNIHGNALIEFKNTLIQLLNVEESLCTVLGVEKQLLNDKTSIWIENNDKLIRRWHTHIDKLKDWYQWLSICDKLEHLNIGFVAQEYKSQNIPTNALAATFEKSLCRAVMQYIISKEPALELFKGELFNNVIQKYKELSANFEELTKKELYAKLASGIPHFTQEATQNSEVGILQRNIKNNGRGISIRKLFDQIPHLLSRMSPCMLMSPISVAQYIDPDADKFDLIVFDEASQMPTYEAIGAIARGKNIVIVGDPQQMPPTNFFSTNSVDEEHIEIEDMESILDDCLALSMPSKYLLWHYRSKHESLIAFSNSEYYRNKLLTFPSPDNIESKVRLIPVKGFYDKGKTRQNKAEAETIVAEVERRLSDEILRKRSIGIVTFSSTQQILIEDLLSNLFLSKPYLEPLALECGEPLFIKNLENVQGDERDIILFSVGYGADETGRVSMNFGPLNRIGGERRLNVAVSRARYEMIIYSTLQPDQIDLNRTSSVGVAGLKRFLVYAERGEQMRIDNQTSSRTKHSIENAIAKELCKSGYIVHTNIGSSGYKIDIGIVDKKNPANYVLGILCDGENYKQTKTARDREIVQRSVLKQLGWNIYQVWTMDWWENKQKVIDNIFAAINHAAENSGSNQPQIEVPIEKKELPGIKPVNEESYPIQSTISKPEFSDIDKSTKQEYNLATLVLSHYPSEEFLSYMCKDYIISQIKEVIETEAPISRNMLCKKILSSWNISRLGTRIDNYFDQLLDQLPYYYVKHEDLSFVWINEEQWRLHETYRPNSSREAVDLPPEEVACGIKEILTNQISLPTKDLSRIAAQLFGFSRSGTNVESAIYKGMKEAVRREYIKVENGRAVIINQK